jgi:predicted DNA-binding protein (UPF0251 family)
MRPRSIKKIQSIPTVTYFKPRGVPLCQLEIVELTLEECEALRLKHLESCEQKVCAHHMATSQSTVQRLLSSAYEKIADALINGKAIQITSSMPEDP